MKWVKLVVIILGALVGAFLFGFGALLWLFGGTPVMGSVFIIGGGVVFLCALIFGRQIAYSIQRVGKYLWAIGKYLWAKRHPFLEIKIC